MENNQKLKQARTQNILIIVLTVFVVALGILYFIEKKRNIVQVEVNTDLSVTKDSLENRLVEMIAEYETIQTTNNDINEQLLTEKERVKELLTNLRNERSYNRSKIAEYEKELGTMRKIMQSYIVQIDSLNQSNIALRTENRDVRQRMQTVETENKEVTRKYEEASEKVDIASTLRAINIVGNGLSKRDKEVSRARNIEKLRVCFTLDQNYVAPAGARDIYILITRPDNVPIENTEGDTLFVDNSPLIYSAKREIDYQQEAIDACVFVNTAGAMPKGIYKIEIFADQRAIGLGTMSFK